MLFLDDLLLSPITGFKFILRTLARAAEEEQIQNRRMQMAGVTPEESERMGRPMLETPFRIPRKAET